MKRCVSKGALPPSGNVVLLTLWGPAGHLEEFTLGRPYMLVGLLMGGVVLLVPFKTVPRKGYPEKGTLRASNPCSQACSSMESLEKPLLGLPVERLE